MARIYVASSWRNNHQPIVVKALREAGHEVYDFKKPGSHAGFSWSHIAGDLSLRCTDQWSASGLTDALAHPAARAGFDSDHTAMEWADAFVMVLPCGKSAHLELGWACGRGKRTLILMAHPDTAELMYLEADAICGSVAEVIDRLSMLVDEPFV